MNCPQARFLLYAYFDRELTRSDAEALSRHLALCPPCRTRAESARGLARVLHSRLGRKPVPARLRTRLQMLPYEPARPRTASYFFAAAMALLIVPVVADGPTPRHDPKAPTRFVDAAEAATPLAFVSKRMTGTFVCVECEGRSEGRLSLVAEPVHVPGFCADNGEIWRLMTRDPHSGHSDFGRSATLEGTAFPQSGFLRANRVGY
jgi:anti-sigma factor (TIGR02949 family)